MKKRERSKYVNLTEKKGISLIVLIITIIVIIILAAVVILTITKNNPVDSAKEATFKEDVKAFQDDLALTVAKQYTDKQGQRDQKISTSDYNEIKNYIPSFTEKYKDKFIIQDDQLVGTDSLSEKEKTWANDINISTSGKVAFDATKWDNNATDENCFLWAEDGTTITGLDETKLAGVKKIRIPSRCTAIRSDYAYLGTESYRSFIGGIEEVEIPDTVTEIGSYAFHNFLELKKINIPNSVTRIGQESFYLCKSLESVTIPNSVTSIGEYAFEDCSSLTSITIPESVTSIGYCAFDNCSSLTNITIPNSVTSIGSFAFSGCSSLTNINVSDNNKNYSSIDGVLFNKDKTVIIQYPIKKDGTSYAIPNSVTSIGSCAFSRCSSLTSITIPNSVTSIGEYAFEDCSSLTSITIPESVTSIGYCAFDNCSSLTNITIPNSVTSIGSFAFSGCSSLTNITYNGTQSQWNSIISKNSNWKNNSEIKTITCTDGVIQIN